MTIPYTETIPLTSHPDPYLPWIKQILQIEDVTWGTDKDNYLVRYRGRLSIDSDQAYDLLATGLRPMDVTPLFREEKEQHVILLMRGVVRPRPSNPWINLMLFSLTGISVILVGIFTNYDGPLSANLSVMRPHLLPAIGRGLAYAASLLAILLAHEFGHYLAGRFHRSAVTLPYFIPLPLPPFGTLGAFIKLKEPPKNKRILLDIGLAGPLAGFVVAVPLLILGLSLSNIDRIQLSLPPGYGFTIEGNSLLYLFMKYLVFGQLLPQPVSFGGFGPIIYWIRYLFTAQPFPLGGQDVMLHPVAYAGWAGLLITALNLIPAGQLDGGHIANVLLGSRARSLLPFVLVALIVLGLAWNGWWLWALIIFFLGRVYAEPLDQITPLDNGRRAMAILGLVIFVLVFTPVPLTLVGPY